MQKKCEILLLTSTAGIENESLVLFNNNKLKINNAECALLPSLNPLKANLYILSDDKILDGDYFINCHLNKVVRKNNSFEDRISQVHFDKHKKIIATTNDKISINLGKEYHPFDTQGGLLYTRLKLFPQLSKEFIQRYINAYNAGNPITSIMVEYAEHRSKQGDWESDFLKVNSSNEISISEMKDIWTREEVTILLKSLDKHVKQYNHYFEGIDKFIKENL